VDNKLLNSIVSHVFSNFAVVEAKFIDLQKTKSLINNDFLINNKLSFYLDDNTLIENKVWGCQFSSENSEIKILLGDCSISEDKEYCMIVKMKDSPAYGLYISTDSDSILACSINEQDWMDCSTYLQATFLAGMEQIKELCLNWNKCHSYDKEYNILLSFIKYSNSILE
jgi:hypothetical protein